MKTLLTSLFGSLLYLMVSSAHACSFHDLGSSSGFEPVYPGAFTVAIAIAEAKTEALIPSQVPPLKNKDFSVRPAWLKARQTTPQANAYMSLILNLNILTAKLRGELKHHHSDKDIEDFSLVLVRSRLWSKFNFTEHEILSEYHINGPEQNTPVIITDAIVMSAIFNGQISVTQAFEKDLILLSGAKDNTLKTFLISALD